MAFIGGMIKNPWKPVVPTAEGKRPSQDLRLDPRFTGETIYLAHATGMPGESPFVKMRPEDLDAGAMETVFPWRESDGDGTTVESHEKPLRDRWVCNPVMLIRIKPVDLSALVKRKWPESFNFGELFAHTKVCSHLGCPARCTSSRPTASCAVPSIPVRRLRISRVRSSVRPHAP